MQLQLATAQAFGQLTDAYRPLIGGTLTLARMPDFNVIVGSSVATAANDNGPMPQTHVA